jgi:hypothetical protein
MKTYTITLTEQQLMLVLAGLGDRYVTLKKLENEEQRPGQKWQHKTAITECNELNHEIRRQAGIM